MGNESDASDIVKIKKNPSLLTRIFWR